MKKDTKEKEYFADEARFADLFNYYLFHGKNVINAEDLTEQDSTEVLTGYGKPERDSRSAGRTDVQKEMNGADNIGVAGEDRGNASGKAGMADHRGNASGKTGMADHIGSGILEQKWRDLLKLCIVKTGKDAVYVLLGLESQSEVHYAMPVRTMLYDAMNYGDQVRKASRQHKKDKDYKDSAEFLSGFTREDKLTPVITLTIYLGAGEWDGPRKLSDMFPGSYGILAEYVNDYKLNLIIPAEISDFEHFETEVGKVLEILQVMNSKEAAKKKLDSDWANEKISRETASAINVFTGLNIPLDEKEEMIDMANVWDEIKEDYRREGIQKGKIEAARETARVLFLKNVPYETVRDATSVLSDAELKQIRDEVNMQLV